MFWGFRGRRTLSRKSLDVLLGAELLRASEVAVRELHRAVLLKGLIFDVLGAALVDLELHEGLLPNGLLLDLSPLDLQGQKSQKMRFGNQKRHQFQESKNRKKRK